MKFTLSKILERLKSFFGLSKKNALSQVSFDEKKELDKKLVFGLAKKRLPAKNQWRYIKNILTPTEKFVINACFTIIIAALIFLGIRYYGRHVNYLPKDGGKYVEAMVGAPKYVNPVLCQTSDVDHDLVKLIFSSLMKYDDQGALIPDLTEKYEISEDQKTYTFYLRKDVKWHDGENLSANDVLYTIETIQDPEYNSPLLYNLKGIAGEKIDDYTFKLTLKEPFSPFLSTLTFGILPQHLYLDVFSENFRLIEYNLKPIGSGPFKFKTLTRGSLGNIKSYNLERNEDYYGQKPYLDNLIFRFYPDMLSAVEALKNKNVEGISYLSKEYQEKLPAKLNLNYYDLLLPQYAAVFFNTKNSVLSDQKVRQALAYASDRAKIISEVLKGKGEIVDGPILKGFLGYHPDIKKYNFDLTEAEKILDEAGWKKNEEGKRVKGSDELKFTLTTVNQSDYAKAAEILKAAWEEAGFSVELNLVENERLQKEVIKPRTYDAFLYGEIIGYDPDPYPFWHSSQERDPGLNLSIYFDKQIDKVLEQARVTSDEKERSLKYVEFQNLLANDLPAIFLYTPYYTYGLAKKIKGFDLEKIVSPQDRFADVEKWYIKTRRAWK
ncbi:MAG: ABC transporter substrate-binding protein [Patescibacteria group bacterium]